MTPTFDEVHEMVASYMECAMWSSHDNATPDGGEPIDANYDEDDWTAESVAAAVAACAEFIQMAWPDIREAVEVHRASWEQIGHDLWLTRNHHGAGFWDRGWDAPGDRLTEHADSMGEAYLGVEDGRVYHE